VKTGVQAFLKKVFTLRKTTSFWRGGISKKGLDFSRCFDPCFAKKFLMLPNLFKSFVY